MNCLTPYYTMRRIVAVLNDNKITEEFIDDISKVCSVAITPTSVNTPTIGSVKPPPISKEEEIKWKKAHHKANKHAKNLP